MEFRILVSCIYVIICLNFQPDQSPHTPKSKGGGGIFAPHPPGTGIDSQTPVQIGLRIGVTDLHEQPLGYIHISQPEIGKFYWY